MELKISCCKHQFKGVIAQNKTIIQGELIISRSMSTLTINKSWEFVHSIGRPIKIIEVHILVSRTMNAFHSSNFKNHKTWFGDKSLGVKNDLLWRRKP